MGSQRAANLDRRLQQVQGVVAVQARAGDPTLALAAIRRTATEKTEGRHKEEPK